MLSLGNNISISVNNHTLSYHDKGPVEAPALIFIHGFPFNKSTWDLQLEALQDNYRVIAYDVRGHGNSDAGRAHLSIKLFAHDLISLMDALKLDKAVVCGLSMGGYIALQAMETSPQRFDALILSDTQCTADTPEGKEKRINTIENIRSNGIEKFADESIKNLFAPGSFMTKQKEIAAVRQMIVDTAQQSLCDTLLALAEREETCSKLSEIKVPVLILVGNEDKLTPPAAARFMHEKIPGSSLSIVPNAGHLANIENPTHYNKELNTFVRQLFKVHTD